MEQEIENFKISQIKSAVYSCIIDLSIIATQIGVIIERQQPVNIETYNSKNFFISSILTLLFLIVEFFLVVGIMVFRKYTEKDDELSKLHRYKAGYISKYITAALFFIVLLVVKDFSFAFTGDFIDDLSLPIIILITGELISDITFIILEKFQLD